MAPVPATTQQTSSVLRTPSLTLSWPKKSEPSGPRPGSIRSTSSATGGVLSVGSLHRAKRQLETLGEVRDQRKHNKSEAKLSLAQTEAVVSLIYDEWIQHKHVEYGKVKEFTRRVQCDEEICSALGIEPIDL